MNNHPKRFKKIISWLTPTLILVSFIFILIGFWFLFHKHDGINKQQALTGIIIPMICAIIGACIPIAMDNSLSNEKLKISLDRLKFHWKNFCKDKDGNKVDGSASDRFDKEYRFIYKYRGKDHNELLNLMVDDYFWEEKYLNEKGEKEITKEMFLRNRIEDHFIY